MTLLGALVVLLHLRRHNLDFLHTYRHTYIIPTLTWKFMLQHLSRYKFIIKIWSLLNSKFTDIAVTQ